MWRRTAGLPPAAALARLLWCREAHSTARLLTSFFSTHSTQPPTGTLSQRSLSTTRSTQPPTGTLSQRSLSTSTRSTQPPAAGTLSQRFIELEERYGSKNYHPLPIVWKKASKIHVWDVDGNQYIDCLSAYSAVNQGHCHPRLVKAMNQQMHQLTLPSRAFLSDQMGPYAQYITQLFGYDRVLPMNTGVEGGETALKLARRWAYDVKGVPHDQALVVVMENNFFGRTLAAVSASTDPESYGGYGPFLPGFIKIPYNDLGALRSVLSLHSSRIAAVMVEPIQGEAGVVVPDVGYLAGIRKLCTDHRVLWIADEVQTGLGRTGALLACDHESVKPDVLILGKALSGGMLPVSAVLADDEVMLTIQAGQHGSTFGGNPLACAVAHEALRVILDEGLIANAAVRGEQMRTALRSLGARYPGVVINVRGKGLLNALVIDENAKGQDGQPVSAWDLCMGFARAQSRFGASKGVLAKPTHGTVIRLAPPLVITKAQVEEVMGIMEKVFEGMFGRG